MYYYIYKICNFFLNLFYSYKSKILFIQDIKTSFNNKKITLFKLYFFYYLNFVINNLPIKTKLYIQNILNNFDNNELIKIKLSNGRINRNIIYKNISSYNISEFVKLNYIDNDLFNENEIMMMRKRIILDIFIKKDNNEKISVKSLIEDYADKNKKFKDNKIKNILQLENIDSDKIYLTYLQGIKRLEKEYNLEYSDYHVSDIYDF